MSNQKWLNSYFDDDDEDEDEEKGNFSLGSIFGEEDTFVKKIRKPVTTKDSMSWNLRRFRKPSSFKGHSSINEEDEQQGGKKRTNKKRTKKKKSSKLKKKKSTSRVKKTKKRSRH